MPTTKSTKDLYEDTIKGLKKNETKMDAIEAAGKKAIFINEKNSTETTIGKEFIVKKIWFGKIKIRIFL